MADDIIHRFEIEHIFNEALWNDPDTRAFLVKHGYKPDAVGNQMGEFSDPDLVERLQFA